MEDINRAIVGCVLRKFRFCIRLLDVLIGKSVTKNAK